MQGVVDLHRQMARGLVLGQFLFAAEYRQSTLGVIRAGSLGGHRRRGERRERRDDIGEAR
ncbi:hypothetical protein D3C83_111630 [compost metagenome]